MYREFTRRLTLGAAFLLLASSAASAQAVNTDKQNVGANAHDLVSYFTEHEAVPGLATITTTHDGITYRFSTEAHREAFIADPAKYLPAYGGYCAFGVSRGYKVKTDPDAFSIVDGVLYLNYDKGVQRQWKGDTQNYIAKANSNWPKLKDAPRK